MAITVIRASVEHVDDIAPLFDLYRQFYEQNPDAVKAHNYITARLTADECVIFLAYDGDKAVGFTQLYPTFCSVEAIKIYVLYDLYVDASARKSGVGEALMTAASNHAKSAGAKRLELSTAITNTTAQSLYERLGWVRDTEYYSYALSID